MAIELKERPAPPSPREITTKPRRSDQIFRMIVTTGGMASLVILGLIALFLSIKGVHILTEEKLGFITGSAWEVEEKDCQSAKAPRIVTIFFLFIDPIISLPKALQVLCHLFRQRQVFCVKPFDLIDRCSSVLGKVEDVHFAMAIDDPHTNRRMTQGIQRMSLACERIDLKPSSIQQGTKLSDVSAHGTVLRDCVVEGLRLIFTRVGVEDDEETHDDEGACRAGR